MCKNAYEQVSKYTGKIMIFCKRKGNNASLSELCISQRFCSELDKYIPHQQKERCKDYED